MLLCCIGIGFEDYFYISDVYEVINKQTKVQQILLVKITRRKKLKYACSLVKMTREILFSSGKNDNENFFRCRPGHIVNRIVTSFSTCHINTAYK